MKAVLVAQPGGPEQLELVEVADPQPGPGEVVIAIEATALNRADISQRRGNYPPPPGAPPYPGLECAGVIERVGAGVTRWRPGQRVMALLGGGGYAEQVAVPQETVMEVPESLSLYEAAAIPEAWLTAYSNMVEIGRLVAGERVLIHAGASGVGSAAISLAKWMGATVFSTVSTGKVAQVERLGADAVIDYQQHNFADRVAELTGGAGVDLIIDFIGAPYWHDNLRALALWGRLVLVGLLGGAQANVNLGLFLSKKISVHGSTLRDRTIEQKGRLVAAFTREVLPAFARGELAPLIDPRSFRLDEIAEAHRYMEANQNVGKIIVKVR